MNKSWNTGLIKKTEPRLMQVAQKISITRKKRIAEGTIKVGHPQTEETKRKLSETRKKLFRDGKIEPSNGGKGRKVPIEELTRRSKGLKRTWKLTKKQHDLALMDACNQVNSKGCRAVPLRVYVPDGFFIDWENKLVVAIEIERKWSPKNFNRQDLNRDFDDVMTFCIDESPMVIHSKGSHLLPEIVRVKHGRY